MTSIIHSLSLTLFVALLFSPNPTFSADVPEPSPSPSPQLPPQAISPYPTPPAPSPAFPDSPPAPPPSRLAPDSPSLAPSEHKKLPSPAPNAVADADQSHLDESDRRDDSGGMSGGKKAGIVIGVIAAGCVVWLAAMVYKKRQHNIRRRQYTYTDRRDFM